jgi:hypothetical protein
MYIHKMSLFGKRQKVKEEVKVFLHVPYEYKEQAKKLGARWCMTKKEWYTIQSNEHAINLIDIFHKDNFEINYCGVRMRKPIITAK